MDDVEVLAAPSAADAPIEIPRSNTPEYAEWRKSGTLPEKTPEAKTVEPPTTDTPKAETAVEPEPAAGKQQESRRKPDAEARIRELTDEARKLREELTEARKPKEAKADPPPARQPVKVNSEPTPEDKNEDGTPKFKTYEEFTKALARHMAMEILTEREQEQAQAKQLEAMKSKIDDAVKRYPDYLDKAVPVYQEIIKEGFPKTIHDVIDDSPVMADLLYALGGTKETADDFLSTAKTHPSKALRVVLIMEQAIQEELKGQRSENGQFKAKEEAPAKRGPDSAPKPPIEIGSRGGLPKETDAAETGDFRAFARERNAADLRRLKGA